MPARDYLEGLCRWDHRGSTTENERQASEYIRKEMSALGLDTRIERFVSHTSFSWVQLIIFVGFFVAGWVGWSHPFWGTAICILMLAGFYGECTSKWTGIANILPKRPSQNVIGILKNEQAMKKVIFIAHYDSSKSGLSFHPSLVGSFRNSFIIAVVMMLALTQALIIRLFGGGGGLLAIIRFVATAYMLIPITLMIHREIFGQYVQGAADNASGTAGLLGVAEKLVKNPPKNFEAWFLATGCEEVNLVGMAAFMQAHQYELNPQTTYFINYDNLGVGFLKYTAGEGMLTVYPSSTELVSLAEKLTAQEEFADIKPLVFRTGGLDSTVASSRGYKTLTLMCVDETGGIPHWHWPTDTLENVDITLTEKAVDFTLAMAEAMDT